MISTFNKIRFSKIKYGLYFVFAILLIACAFYNQKIAKKILSIDFIEQRLSKNIPDKIWLLAAIRNKDSPSSTINITALKSTSFITTT